MARKDLPPEVQEAHKIVGQFDRHWKRGFMYTGAGVLIVLTVLMITGDSAFAALAILGVGVGVGYFWAYTKEVLMFAAASQIVHSHERRLEREKFGDFDKYRGDEVPSRVEKARDAVGKFRMQVMVFGTLLIIAPMVHFFVTKLAASDSTKLMAHTFAVVYIIGVAGAWLFIGGNNALSKWWKARAILEEWERFRIETLSRREYAKREADEAQRKKERMGRY